MNEKTAEQLNRSLNNQEIKTENELANELLTRTKEPLIFIYIIFDTLAELHGPSFEAVNDQVALRNFRNLQAPDKSEFVLKRIAARSGTTITPDFKIIQTKEQQ